MLVKNEHSGSAFQKTNATQLKYDHSNEFERGGSTSYYQSFVDGDGNCTHLVKIKYVQTAPFEAERKFTIIK